MRRSVICLTFLALFLPACRSTFTPETQASTLEETTTLPTDASTAGPPELSLASPTITTLPTGTSTPTPVPTPSVTPTPTPIPSPAISPTPIPQELLFMSLSVPVGGKWCGEPYFDGLAYQIAYANRQIAKTNYYSFVATYEQTPSGIAVQATPEATCFSTTTTTPPGSYAVPVKLTIYEEQSNIPNSQTSRVLVEETHLIHIRILPQVSATTGLISFISNAGGDYGLYLTNQAGTELTLVASGLHPPVSYSWSPDGSHIAYPSFEGLMVSNHLGTEKIPLVEMSAYGSDEISWSPDSQWVLATGSGRTDNIFKVDGSRSAKLPPYARGITWAPDSSRFAYYHSLSNQTDLFISDTTGAQIAQLTNDPDLEKGTAWSPDGRWIAYVIGPQAGYLNIISPEGGEPTILSTSASPFLTPKWSPDGTRLAFEQVRDREHQLMMVKPDGSDPVAVSGELNTGISHLTWSPDGKKIAYINSNKVYLINADGSEPVTLAEHSGEVLSFSPDARYLLALEYHNLVVINIEDGEVRTLMPDNLAWQSSGQWQP